jgi:hypothetical protein
MKNIEEYKKRFFNLLESEMGDVKPLITEVKENTQLNVSPDYKAALSFFSGQYKKKVQNPVYYGSDLIYVVYKYYDPSSSDPQTGIANAGYAIAGYRIAKILAGFVPVLSFLTRFKYSPAQGLGKEGFELYDATIGSYEFPDGYKNLEKVSTLNSLWAKPYNFQGSAPGIESISWGPGILNTAKAQSGDLTPRVQRFIASDPTFKTTVYPKLTGYAKSFYDMFPIQTATPVKTQQPVKKP